EYNGLKFNTEKGAPALPKVTDQIEQELQQLSQKPHSFPYYPKSEFIEKIDLQNDYLSFIQNKIDFDLLRKSKIKVAVDLLYGTSREYLDEILEENHIPIEELHGYIDPYFGGFSPSCAEESLKELKDLIKEKKCNLGIATDSDGDRFGVVDDKGKFIIQNLILSLLLDYLTTEKGWRGGIARSIATTHLVDRIARQYDLPLYKTPVGFKYLADLFLKNKIIFGGEESACMAIKDHLPEKDGIFAGLLVTEMIASKGKTLSEQIKDLFKRYGKRVGQQKMIPLNSQTQRKLNKLIQKPPAKLADRKVLNIETIEGIKLDFSDDDWVLFRFSGTEPVIRCYGESGTKKELKNLMDAGMNKII
ncbi:hypothetical protein KGY73_05510, partial [bacterium]|nr:hypothetical protein [bacterium]